MVIQPRTIHEQWDQKKVVQGKQGETASDLSPNPCLEYDWEIT